MRKSRVDKSKVLFLDIDGVLNSEEFFTSAYHDRLKLSRGEQGIMHDPRAVKLLGDIYKATKCRIVMSSTWKSFFFKKDKTSKFLSKPLKKELKKYGIFIKDWTDWSRNLELEEKYQEYVWRYEGNIARLVKNPNKVEPKEFYGRGLQIKHWLDYHPEVKYFVVLDDIKMDLGLFGESYIKCNPDIGLTQAEVDKAIKILRG